MLFIFVSCSDPDNTSGDLGTSGEQVLTSTINFYDYKNDELIVSVTVERNKEYSASSFGNYFTGMNRYRALYKDKLLSEKVDLIKVNQDMSLYLGEFIFGTEIVYNFEKKVVAGVYILSADNYYRTITVANTTIIQHLGLYSIEKNIFIDYTDYVDLLIENLGLVDLDIFNDCGILLRRRTAQGSADIPVLYNSLDVENGTINSLYPDSGSASSSVLYECVDFIFVPKGLLSGNLDNLQEIIK